MKAKRRQPKTHEATYRGRKARVPATARPVAVPGTVPERHETVAYSGDAAEVLRDVLRDSLSPQAVAVIAGHLHGMVNTKSHAVNREVAWFTEQLLEMVGDQYNALCEEAGL